MRVTATSVLMFLAAWSIAAVDLTLSITNTGQGGFWIEATGSAETPCRLQASVNLRLWVDLEDQVRGAYRCWFERAAMSRHFFRLASWQPPAPPIRLMLIGDSTVADCALSGYTYCGWGQGVYEYFRANVQVVNIAHPGTSTIGFLVSGPKTAMVIGRPDVVLVQFGQVDEFGHEHARTTLQQYEENLRLIVQAIREIGATPVLITPPVPRSFDQDGHVKPAYGERCAVVRRLSRELTIPLVDLNQMTTDLFNRLGDSGSAFISRYDAYHFSQEGARVIAGLVVNALPGNLGPYLKASAIQPWPP